MRVPRVLNNNLEKLKIISESFIRTHFNSEQNTLSMAAFQHFHSLEKVLKIFYHTKI